ncbi:Dehydrogenase/reductase (SDR family) member [Candidatus Sulfopaludibacter sp. SbA6]|nr:Dehydrogenase/reductase (SDR family) member [Candidatus Sulfopaludibacter sp. SbA6]
MQRPQHARASRRRGLLYCSGRSTREHPAAAGFYAGRPETIDETAEMVTRYGGRGIPVRTDHLVPEQVEALVDRVRREQGRLDVLVNDISEGEPHEWKPFWKVDIEKGFRMLRNALHSHIITSRHAVPLMLEHRGGLIAEIGDGDTLDYRATLFYDLVKISVSRLALAMAEDLHRQGVAAVAITPGFMRTEAILDHFGVTEANWREGGKKDPNFLASETPFFVGRAIAAVAQDPRRMEKSGGLYSSWGLAREYGFTDIDGSQPDFSQQVDIEAHFRASLKTGFRWTISRRETAPQKAAK